MSAGLDSRRIRSAPKVWQWATTSRMPSSVLGTAPVSPMRAQWRTQVCGLSAKGVTLNH